MEHVPQKYNTSKPHEDRDTGDSSLKTTEEVYRPVLLVYVTFFLQHTM